MTNMQQVKKQDDLELSFHNWRHNDVISKLFFNHVGFRIKEATYHLKNLYQSNYSDQAKIIKLGALSASIELLEGLLNLGYEDVNTWRKDIEAEK